MARVVTIVVLIILAGITLNAVIGEGGIIFQARDTRNKISNETTYDNAQLAQLQNELKDNQLYSGIGIIPGTDTGGGSEGGENGTVNPPSGNQNTGGNLSRPTNENTGGGQVPGLTAKDPTIYVLAGEEIAASVYRSDVTLQIITPEDKTQKIKYVLNTTVEEINKELYPSGLIRELDIENGGTLTFTKDGEYTLTAYAYDTYGNKSNPTIMWFKRQTEGNTTGGIAVRIASGNKGENEWYTSNVTLRVLGTDAGSSEVRYRVRGKATSLGLIGEFEVTEIGNLDTGEIKIANGTTLKIMADGVYTITAYSYDAGGVRLSSSESLELKKDATRPVVNSFTGEQILGSGFKVTVVAEDIGAGLTTNPYTYNYKESTKIEDYTTEVSGDAEKIYIGLDQQKTYDMYVMLTDQAGNRTITDMIVRPSLWISNNVLVGESEKNGIEGKRKYSRSDIVELTFRGQDSNNVEISRTTYQIIGKVIKEGNVAGNNVTLGQELSEEYEVRDKETKTIAIQADGNFTVKIHNYDKRGKLVTTNVIEVTRDVTPPEIVTFVAESLSETSALVNVDAIDSTSGLATGDVFQFLYGNAIATSQESNSFTFNGLNRLTDYAKELKVKIKDKAGNVSDELAPTVIKYYLVDRVAVGDVVLWDAGVWEESIGIPQAHGEIGGITKGVKKDKSVGGKLDGWKVVWKGNNGADGYVRLVSNGAPCLQYIAGADTNDSVYSNVLAFVEKHYKIDGLIANTIPLDSQGYSLDEFSRVCDTEYWVDCSSATYMRFNRVAYSGNSSLHCRGENATYWDWWAGGNWSLYEGVTDRVGFCFYDKNGNLGTGCSMADSVANPRPYWLVGNSEYRPSISIPPTYR